MQLQQIVKVRVPFAVKGCGHSVNPGFSSTTGIQLGALLLVEESAILHRRNSREYPCGRIFLENNECVTVDSVTEFHLVSPNGLQTVVTEADKDPWINAYTSSDKHFVGILIRAQTS